jgi:hypothetical protein
MTAEEAIKLAHDPSRADHREEIKSKFIANAGPKALKKFLYGILAQPGNEYFNWARIALDVRIARDLSGLNVILIGLTFILIILTMVLIVLTFELVIRG